MGDVWRRWAITGSLAPWPFPVLGRRRCKTLAFPVTALVVGLGGEVLGAIEVEAVNDGARAECVSAAEVNAFVAAFGGGGRNVITSQLLPRRARVGEGGGGGGAGAVAGGAQT
jgi:hypothetical protein